MKKNYRSDCGLYWYSYNKQIGDYVKYHYHPSQENVWTEFQKFIFTTSPEQELYWDKQAYLGSVEFLNSCRGMKEELNKLLVFNPHHHFQYNIKRSIAGYDDSIEQAIIKINSYPEHLKK